jgi:uncharacterized protein YutE (UPF0331/DUF86 family)
MIKKLKAGPLEAEFEREVKELRSETEAQLPPVERAIVPEPARQKLLQLAEINPRSAIIEAWQSIEFAAHDLLNRSKTDISMKSSSSPLTVIRALTKERLLNPDEIALFHELRALRNQAIHAADFTPTQQATLDYIELASRLEAALKRTSHDMGND